jgi:hypothetical protein
MKAEAGARSREDERRAAAFPPGYRLARERLDRIGELTTTLLAEAQSAAAELQSLSESVESARDRLDAEVAATFGGGAGEPDATPPPPSLSRPPRRRPRTERFPERGSRSMSDLLTR